MRRATPEEILKKIKAGEQSDAPGGGRLKIFFGYAAGVGKTYAMLQAAHDAVKKGIDVAAGYIEPHTRPETMKLLEGLNTVPPLELEYRGIAIRDFDLDGALERHPGLILVDELAHTNAEGCRHAKRYQDIKELLSAGIDVYTTVNVQHIESLNDIVASITGVVVHERIPDHIFDRADQVELVDIEPSELIQRLQEGKIYRPSQADQALHNFFSVENLTALREIALRRCADRVYARCEQEKLASGGEYYTEEHILVCLSASPSNAKLIRTAARMARAFKGTITALYVETPDSARMGVQDKKRLAEHIHLARQLGAKVETVYGEDIPFQIAAYARLSGVSKIVVGRSNTKRHLFFARQSFAERLTECAPNLDIYIIPDKSVSAYKRTAPSGQHDRLSARDCLKALGVLAGATLLGLLFFKAGFSEANIIIVFLLGVLVTAVVTEGRLYSITSSLISVIVFNFFFTVPRYTLNAYDPSYPVTFLIMFLAAFISSSLAVKIKRQAVRSAETAYRTKILLETNQLLQKERDTRGIIQVTANQLIKLLHKPVVFYHVEEEEKKRVLKSPVVFTAEPGDEINEEILSENEQAVAQWTFTHNKHAGATTSTLGNARCLYLAVRGTESVYGVVGITQEGEKTDSFEDSLVLSIIGESGLALEKDEFSRKKEEAAAQAKNEQLRSNLLRSISHDLRTPLTSISGNAGMLLNNSIKLPEEKKTALYTDIYDDSMWLINLVENLLAVTRIENGTITLRTQMELMEEVVTEALRHVSRKSAEHHITVQQDDDFILAKMDAKLIIQVLINLVDNAVKYTPPGSDICIRISKEDHHAVVEVADNGPGIPDESKEKVFDMFYTANDAVADSRRSLGLGLALCKSIITAHDGEIKVEDNKPKGAVFKFTLPAKEADLHE